MGVVCNVVEYDELWYRTTNFWVKKKKKRRKKEITEY